MTNDGSSANTFAGNKVSEIGIGIPLFDHHPNTLLIAMQNGAYFFVRAEVEVDVFLNHIPVAVVLPGIHGRIAKPCRLTFGTYCENVVDAVASGPSYDNCTLCTADVTLQSLSIGHELVKAVVDYAAVGVEKQIAIFV